MITPTPPSHHPPPPQGADSQAKVQSIQDTVIHSINSRCESCELTQDRITSGRLRCFDESLTTVIYRAEIHGTIERTASELLTDVEQWVENQPRIQVLSVDISLLGECGVRIQSFGDDRCPAPAPVSSLPVIVGGALGGVIVVSLCCVVVVLVAVVRQRRRKRRLQFAHDLRG